MAVCLCVLPVIYAWAVFVVLPVVVAVERTNAIARCFRLFHGDLGSSVARIATIFGLSVGAAVVGAGIAAAVSAGARLGTSSDTAGTIVGSVVATLISGLIGAAVAVLVAPLTLTAYADMRARVEPVNGMMIAQQLGIAGAGAPGPYWPGDQQGGRTAPAG